MLPTILEQLGLDFQNISNSLDKTDVNLRTEKLNAIVDTLLKLGNELAEFEECVYGRSDSDTLPNDDFNIDMWVRGMIKSPDWSETLQKIGIYLWTEVEEKNLNSLLESIHKLETDIAQNYNACQNLKIKHGNDLLLDKDRLEFTNELVVPSEKRKINWKGTSNDLAKLFLALDTKGLINKTSKTHEIIAECFLLDGEEIDPNKFRESLYKAKNNDEYKTSQNVIDVIEKLDKIG